MKVKITSYLKNFLKFAIGFGIFGYFVASGQIQFDRIQNAMFHSPWFLVAFALGGVTLLTITLRWKVLLESQGLNLGFLKTLQLVFIGHFFNIVIPGTVSGDLVKVYYVTRRKDKRVAAGFSVLMDRFVGLIMLVVLTCVAALVNYSSVQAIPELKWIAQISILGFLGMCCAVSFFLYKKEFALSERWPSFLRSFVEVIWIYRNSPRKVLIAACFALANHVVNIFFLFTVAKSLGENVLTFSQYLFIVPIGFFVMAIPISPAGLGVGQGVFLMLYQWLYAQPVTIGAEIITLYQMVIICWALIGLPVYVLSRHEVTDTKEVTQEKAAVTS